MSLREEIEELEKEVLMLTAELEKQDIELDNLKKNGDQRLRGLVEDLGHFIYNNRGDNRSKQELISICERAGIDITDEYRRHAQDRILLAQYATSPRFYNNKIAGALVP